MTLPLAGVRVLDFTQVYAGPTCARILADLGADVIKVEGLTRIDGVRLLLATDGVLLPDPWNRGFYYSLRNPGKRSLTVELTRESGRDLIRRLIPTVDVVAESFTPRVMKGFGLDYESLRQIRRDLIMISLSGYGQFGPHSGWSAYGMGLEPASGISQTTGYRDGPPMRSGISFTDPLTGFVAAGAVLTALHYRRRTGVGQHIDLSEQEAALALASHALFEYQMTGRSPERRANRDRVAAPQGCYRCRGDDDWLVISVNGDDEWAKFCDAVGHPEWQGDERFRTLLGRHENHDALDRLIEEWTKHRDHYEAFHHLQRAGIAAAPVLNGKELLFDPHLRERGQFDVLEHGAQGKRPIPRNLVAKFETFDARPKSAAPLLGQHNQEVLREAGLSDEEIDGLQAEGVIGNMPVLAAPAGGAGSAGARVVPSFDDLVEVGALLRYETDYKEQLGLRE
jgi:crotonobetainyl-CoA:carnitine CoA-transferase CaiB-like acyl-CoA transferase